MCEIYTDVEGIMTADPRLVKEASILKQISYGEVCQMAHQGAKVIHPRAVEIAMKKNIPLIVKSSSAMLPAHSLQMIVQKRKRILLSMSAGWPAV